MKEITIEIKENGKLVGSIPVNDNDFRLSDAGTHERAYKVNDLPVKDRWGYRINMWIERPNEELRRKYG